MPFENGAKYASSLPLSLSYLSRQRAQGPGEISSVVWMGSERSWRRVCLCRGARSSSKCLGSPFAIFVSQESRHAIRCYRQLFTATLVRRNTLKSEKWKMGTTKLSNMVVILVAVHLSSCRTIAMKVHAETHFQHRANAKRAAKAVLAGNHDLSYMTLRLGYFRRVIG